LLERFKELESALHQVSVDGSDAMTQRLSAFDQDRRPHHLEGVEDDLSEVVLVAEHLEESRDNRRARVNRDQFDCGELDLSVVVFDRLDHLVG